MKTTITTEYIQPEELIDTKANKSQAYSIYPVEPASRRPRQPIAIKNVRPMNPEFTAELDNGTSVELLALTKFEGGALRWWSPEGQPIELPSITAQDIKHQGNIAAFRFYGPVDSFTSYCMIASSMHEIKEKWQIASSGVWLGVLGYPEERNFGKLYFRTKGKPGQTIYTIPIKPSDIGKIRAINQYGVNNIQSFERTAFDGFTIELLHDDKLAGDEFAAVDRAGKMHEYTEGYSARNRSYMKYEFPAEELAAIVRQKFSYSTVQFVNVSLQGKKTKVVIEHIQRGELEQPKVNVDVNPRFIATMPNGVKVSLVALGRLVDGSLQWWTPEAEHTSIPDILECDVEGYDVVLAYKVQGSNGFTSYSIQDDQLHRKKDDWLVRSHQLWMVSLDEAAHVGTADFAVRAYGGPLETRLEIPLSEKEIGQEIEVNWLGYKKVAEFTEVTPDSFRVKVTYNSKKRALGGFAAVDKAGKTHKRTSGAFWPGQCEITFPISAKSLSHLVLQQQQIGQATFRNISLQPGQRTKVRIESRQVDYLIPPSQAKWSVQDITTAVQVEGKEIGKKNGSKWISHSAETNKSPGAQRQIVIEARVFSIKTPNTSIPNYLYSKLGIKNVNTETPLMMPVQLTNEQAGEFEKWASAIPGTTTLVSPKVTAVNGELVDLTLTTQHERIMSYKKPEDSSGKPEPVFEKFTTGVKLGITPELQRDGKAIVLKLAFSKNDLVRVKKDLNESGYEIELPKLTTVSLSTNILVASGKYTLVPVAGLFSTGKIEAGGKQIHQTLLLVKPTILNLASGLQDKPAGQVQGEGSAPKQLSSGGGYQNLNREQRERLERLRANRQSLSYKNMQKLGLAVAVFANDHKGRCPSNLSDLRKYIADEQIFDWINRNVVYLGKNQEYGDPPDAVLAYDESMLKKPRKETNVLYNDAHVSFEKSEWLQEQGIILEQKPAGVGLNEKSINSDSKVKVGGIVQVEDKPVVGEWENISTAIPADFNDTISLAEHITLGSIGQDAEGKTFIALLRDKEKTRNQQYRFVLVRRNGTVMEPASYNPLLFGDKLWERFSFYMPYHHNQIMEFRLQRFPQSLARKASLPVVKPYDPGVNGKIVARATSAPPGRGALHFDGQNEYLYVPDSRSLWMKAPFTVEMWIKPEFPKEQFEGRPGWGLIGKGCIGKDWIFGRGKVEVEMRGFGITLHRFGDDPNLLMVDYCAANAGRVYTKPYGRRDFDDWLHLYHVFRPDRYTPGHTHPLVIGRFLTSEHPFAGQIGEVRIWAGARSRDQISQYRNKPLTGDEPDLVACWTFEQSGGQIAYDVSSNRNHARLGRTTDTDDADPTWVTITDLPTTGSTIDEAPGSEIDDQVLAHSNVGPVGRHALSFDGVDDYLHVAANPTLELRPPFTIEMWLKPDYSDIPRTKASEKLWPFLSLLRKGKRLFFQEKRIQAGGFLMVVGPPGPSPRPDRNWKCLASLYLANAQGQAYQVDGSFGDKLQPAQPGWLYVSMSCTRETYIPVPDQPILIGENIVPSGFPFKGEIADIRIWSKVLTDVDFLRYGYTSLAGSEPNLVACWDFKRPGGQVVYDISPNGNHARLGDSEGPDDADPKWVDLKAASHQPGQNPSVQVED